MIGSISHFSGRRLAIGGAVYLMCVSTSALAQAEATDAAPQPQVTPAPDATTAPDQNPADHGLTDIIVTAEKTGARSVQRVPIAITAVSADTLVNTQATGLQDVGRLAPNVQLQASGNFPGFANFTIRGIGLNLTVRTIDPTVTLVVDGMAFADPLGTLTDTFDVESVEILRGPQGVLLGRNAIGGAVQIRTARPTGEFGVTGSLRVGNAGRFDQSATIQGPITDTLAVKLAMLHRHSSGLSEDKNGGTFVAAPQNPTGVQPANPTTDQVREDTVLIRPSLLWKPSSDLDVSLIAEFVNGTYGGGDGRVIVAKPLLLQQFGYTPPPYGYEINQDFDSATKLKTARITSEVNWHMGIGTLTGVFGYRHVSYSPNNDTDGTPFRLFEFVDGENTSRQFSAEVRLLSDLTSNLKLLTGGYYSDTDMATVEKREFNSGLISATPPYLILYQRGDYTQTAKVAGAFASLDWTIAEKLTLSGGARYTYEKKSIDIVPLGVCTGPSFIGCPSTRSYKESDWNSLSPRVAANYQFTRNIMAYASWSRGFRSGNFNGRASSPLAIGPSDPETADAAEIGFKSTFFDHKVRINLAAFSTQYKNIQKVLQIGAIQSIVNAASARINGLEAELAVVPAHGLTLEGSVGYTDAKYNSFGKLDLTGDGIPDPELAKALKFERVPDFTGTASITYDFRLGHLPGDWSARATYSRRSSFFTDLVNTPALEVPATDTVDASLNYDLEHWKLTLFGRNLTNAKYFDTSFNTNWAYVVFGGEARRYGVEVSFKF